MARRFRLVCALTIDDVRGARVSSQVSGPPPAPAHAPAPVGPVRDPAVAEDSRVWNSGNALSNLCRT